MQPAPSTQFPDGLLAAALLLSRKPRHGVPSRNPAPHQPIDKRNCTAALGLEASLRLNAIGPTEHDGSYDASNPQSFNRYAYVLNNPLSLIDPSGLECVVVSGGDWSITDEGGSVSGSDPTAIVCTDDGGTPTEGGKPVVIHLPHAPNNAISPAAQPCQVKIQNAVNNALNTNSTFLGPTSGPGMSPDGYRNGAYNFNYFAPGVVNPVAGSTNGSGRFPGSGLHIPLPGGADPTISPWGYNAAAGGSYFTAHFDSANPTDDLVSLLIHFFNDVLLRRAHGC